MLSLLLCPCRVSGGKRYLPSCHAAGELPPAPPQAPASPPLAGTRLSSRGHGAGRGGGCRRTGRCPRPLPRSAGAAEGWAEAARARTSPLRHQPLPACSESIRAQGRALPAADDCFSAPFFFFFFSFPFVALMEGTDFITSVWWKEMLKTKGGRQENTV